MKYLAILLVLALYGCGGGGSSEEPAPLPDLEAAYYGLDNPLPYSTNYETITVFDDTDTAHPIDRYNQLFNAVAECMGMGSDYPRLYIVAAIPGGAKATTIFSGANNSAQWINVDRSKLSPYALSHEFIHYILFYNAIFDGLNIEHQSYFFDACAYQFYIDE